MARVKTIVVRNVPDELHRALEARAALEGRTLSLMLVRWALRPFRAHTAIEVLSA